MEYHGHSLAVRKSVHLGGKHDQKSMNNIFLDVSVSDRTTVDYCSKGKHIIGACVCFFEMGGLAHCVVRI